MLDQFLKDEKNKLELVKFEFGDMGNWYEVRHINYKPYMSQFDRIQKKFAKYKRGGQPINEQKERNEMADAFVQHILTDWKFTATKKTFANAFPDIEVISTKEKGVCEVPFSKQNAYAILKDKRMQKLFGYMIVNSGDSDNFEESNLEADLKN